MVRLRPRKSQLLHRLAQRLIPVLRALLQAIQCLVKAEDVLLSVALLISARLFEVNNLVVGQLGVQERGIEIEAIEGPSVAVSEGYKKSKGRESSNGGVGLVEVDAVYLREASSHQTRFVLLDLARSVLLDS